MTRETNTLRNSRRAWIARVVLVVFVVAGLLIFREFVPETTDVSFSVPSMMAADSGTVRREAVTRLDARLIDAEGAEVARAELLFPEGLRSPVTPRTSVSLPAGRYVVSAALFTSDGRRVPRKGLLIVGDRSQVRVALDR